TRPDGVVTGPLGARRLGGEPPGGYPDAAVRGAKEEPDRPVQDPRWRHGLSRGADRAALGANQRPHRPFQDPQEGPPLPARTVDADRQASRLARIFAQEGPRTIRVGHRQARDPQVTADPGSSAVDSARSLGARTPFPAPLFVKSTPAGGC